MYICVYYILYITHGIPVIVRSILCIISDVILNYVLSLVWGGYM